MAKIAATKFKIGDRVRITKNHSFGHPAVGTEFVIESRDEDWNGFASWYGKGSHPFRYREDQLEFVEPPAVEGVAPKKLLLAWVLLGGTSNVPIDDDTI